MIYGVDYDFSNVFYAVVFALVIAVGVYALINPDFFRIKEKKGQPRSVRDIILGIWLIVIGAFLAVSTSWIVFFNVLYQTKFSQAELGQFEKLFCEAVRRTVPENPKLNTLPASPYLLILCMEKSPYASGENCSVECTVIYRSQAYPAESVQKANAYIFVETQGTETGPARGFFARIIVYDKTSNQVFVWFDTQVNQGVYLRSISPDALQRILNSVAERIAQSQKGHRPV